MTTCRKKMIEVALPLETINRESAQEKSIPAFRDEVFHLTKNLHENEKSCPKHRLHRPCAFGVSLRCRLRRPPFVPRTRSHYALMCALVKRQAIVEVAAGWPRTAVSDTTGGILF